MSFFSSSSGHHHYHNGNYGYNHYRRQGVLGGLLNAVFSGSLSSRRHHHYPPNVNYGNVPSPQASCPRCHSAVPNGSNFCLQCGERMMAVHSCNCPGCGNTLDSMAQFCGRCGTKVR